MDNKLLNLLTINKKNDFEEFCDYVSKGFKEHKLVTDLLDNTDGLQSYMLLSKLSWFYFVELQGRHFGEDSHFELSEFSKSFQKFLYSWDRLGRKRVPQEEWSDFVKEGINLLKLLIDEKKLENFKEDLRYQNFMKRFIQRHEDLRKSGKYPNLNELMDD